VNEFTYESMAARVVFGVGSLERLGDEVDLLGASRVLLLAEQRDVGALSERLGSRRAGVFTGIEQHVPIEAAMAATKQALDIGADCLVTIGGGSATGFAKAVAVECDVPIVAIPTTYAGSEVTPIYGITSEGQKRTRRDVRALPRVVIYDPTLTVSLPPEITGPSGMNALAHCVEAFYGPGANPVTSVLAEEGVRVLARGLPVAVRQPKDLDGRSDTLLGAYLAGTALAAAGVAIHHQICHVLGGTFGLPHADLNAVVLPHATRFVSEAVPDEMARVARALNADDAATGLFDLARALDAPASLAQLGMARTDLDRAVQVMVEHVAQRPRRADADSLRALLADAYDGRRPEPATGTRGADENER
jgi:maleylacetate reductase